MTERRPDRPLLSIAMPTYQHGHGLPAALESILASPRASEVEIVVSNNASTDDTAEVLDRYVAGHVNVHALHQPATVTFDENLARAMERCAGRYIWTVSSDDALVEGALETALELLARLERDTLVVSNWWIADGNLRPTRLRRTTPTRLHHEQREALVVAGIWTLFMSCLILPAGAARAELHRYRGGDGLTHWKIATRLAARGTPVLEESTPLVAQRIPDPAAPPYYDVPAVLSRNIRAHLRQLRAETHLGRRATRTVESRFLRIVARGFVGTAMRHWPHVGRAWFRTLAADYWTYPAFWIWIAPLYLIPRPVLRALWGAYVLLRARVSPARARRATRAA